MSANLYWAPNKRGNVLEGGTSSDYDALEHEFGSFPLILGLEHLFRLGAMANVRRGERGDRHSLYHEIIDTINRVGEIKIWKEY